VSTVNQHPSTWRATLTALAIIALITVVCVACEGWRS
jgi:hypothetical protein